MDGTRQEFRGPVENVAGRDVINYVHHSGGQKLTDAECGELKHKVSTLARETGVSHVQIWSMMHGILGRRLRDLHLEHKAAANTILDLLLEQTKLKQEQRGIASDLDQSAKAMTDLTTRNSYLANTLSGVQKSYAELDARFKQQAANLQDVTSKLYRIQEARQQVSSCATCHVASTTIARTRKGLIVAVAAAITAITAAGFLGYQGNILVERAEAAEARLQVCEHDSKIYRLGSVIDIPRAADLKCVVDGPGQAAHWQGIPSPKLGSAKPAKRQQRPRIATKHKRDSQEKPQEESVVTSNDPRELLF